MTNKELIMEVKGRNYNEFVLTNNVDVLEETLKEDIDEKLTNIKIEKVISIGPTVGAHAGPGCTGICWFEK